MAFDDREPFLPPAVDALAPTVRPSRRQLLGTLAGAGALLVPLRSWAADSLVAPPRPATDRWQRVKVVLEIKGELKLNADGRKTTRAPLEVTAQHNYLERLPAEDSEFRQLASLRKYDRAQADFKVGRNNFQTRLDAEHTLIGQQVVEGQLTLFSPQAPLTRDELDLLEVPGNSAVVQQLLPAKPVAAGGTWTAPDLAWAQLLGLETIQQNTVQLKLDRWEGSAAMLQAEGSLQGTVGGVSTDIDLKAKLQFDRKLGQITWVAIGLTEDRAIGHAEPGFRAGMRIRVSIEPGQDAGELSDRAISELPWDLQSANALVVLPAPLAGLRLMADRRWRMMTHRPESVILRLVDHGDLLAQCNLSPLSPLAAGRQLALEELQDDIRQSLGGSFQQFLEATQAVEDGRRVLRTVAVGQASDLPIQWIYYHVSDEQGRRFSAAFSIESELVERFAEADRALVGAIEFVPIEALPTRDPQESSAQTPAADKSTARANLPAPPAAPR